MIKQFIINKSLNHSKKTVFISIILTLIMGFGAKWFTVDDDMMKLLPQDLETRKTWDAVREEFGNTEMIYLAMGIEGKSALNPETLAKCWEVTKALENIPEVDEVMSIASISKMVYDAEFDEMVVDDMMPKQHLSNEQVNDIENYLNKTPSIEIRLLSKYKDFLSIMIRPINDVALDKLTPKIIATGDSILQNYDKHYGGHAYLSGVIPALIQKDVKMLMQIGMLIMILILLINLRSIYAVGMVLSVIILSLVAMLGFMGWVYKLTDSDKFLFTMMNTSMPIILLTIANSDGVHVLAKFFREFRKSKEKRSAITSTMDSLLMPIFLTSITTIVAFLSMLLAPIEQMAGYGITIGFGVAWAWLLSSIMLPSLINLKKWDNSSKAITHASIFEKLIDKFGIIVVRHPKYILSAGMLIVGISIYGIFLVRVEANVTTFFKKGTEIRDSMTFLDEQMTGSSDIQIRIEADIKDPSVLRDMETIQNYIAKQKGVTTTMSIAEVIKQMHRIVEEDRPEFERIPNSRGKVNNLFTMYSLSGDTDDFSSLVDENYEVGLVTGLMKMVTSTEVTEVVNNIQTFAKENVNPNTELSITGMMVVFRDLVKLIVDSSMISISISIFAIALIAAYFFKRFIWGLLAVIPLTSAVLMNFGFMGIFGVEMSHITAILSSIIIGVGVDFAIHYISQYRNLSKNGIPKDKLSREVIDDVGYPIILDAASNMGFGALILSVFLPIQYIGGLMVFAMLSTSIGTLTLLASLGELLKNKLIKD
ncbi:MAG: MMPL family transporter [Candidatus Marinimicrobia bacterium]|nr:MMPL family transporter [Candidatus Neomarinimicrobiota bacterium]MBL7022471.1 MMPL family transporter [Candidatus Neomarinimicrobiota bacterium]MBL7108674.1 MMPL family transporter [Candidatus Neomarinimicrobiota bacterium]